MCSPDTPSDLRRALFITRLLSGGLERSVLQSLVGTMIGSTADIVQKLNIDLQQLQEQQPHLSHLSGYSICSSQGLFVKQRLLTTCHFLASSRDALDKFDHWRREGVINHVTARLQEVL